MAITVSELIIILEDHRTRCGDDAEVRLAIQPNWPFEHDISPDQVQATDLSESLEVMNLEGEWYICDAATESDVEGPFASDTAAAERLDAMKEAHKPVIYIGEGRQIGYLPSEARAALSWGGMR